MDTTELILKFGWIGWTRDLMEIDALVDWLYKEYGIDIEEGLRSPGSFTLVFQRYILCDYFGVMGKNDIIKKILPDILKLWKCEDGELIGPSLENYEEPNTDWT
jgi:hypothetical protein